MTVPGLDPATASADTAASPAAAAPETAASSEQSSEATESRSSDWFDRQVIGRRRGSRRGRQAAQEQPADSTTSESAATTDASKEDTPAEPEPQKYTLSQAELDRFVEQQLERRVQSETDRREAKRRAEEQANQKRQELKALRDKDPFGYAERMEQLEAEEQQIAQQTNTQVAVIQGLTQQFDNEVMGRVVGALPEDVRKKLLKEPVHGITGRASLVDMAIKAIKQQAIESAKADLRKNSAFRKEILAELRDDYDEPELAPAAAASSGGFDMNRMIRRAAGRRA